MKAYDFTKDFAMGDLFYCYPENAIHIDPLRQTEAGLVNDFYADDATGGFIALLDRQQAQTGCRIETQCAFQGSGAPMLVLSGEIRGNRFGRRLEIVAHVGGCNVWDVVPGQRSKKLAYVEFPIGDWEKVSLTAQVRERDIRVAINGHVFGFCRDVLPESFYCGIMACEGACRFDSMTIGGEN